MFNRFVGVLVSLLGGGFKYVLFSPLPGEDSLKFSDGLEPPTSKSWICLM